MEERYKALIDSASMYYFVVHDSALLYFYKILDLLNDNETKKEFSDEKIERQKIKINQCIGTCYNILGQFDTALVYYNLSLTKARELNDTAQIMANINNAAVVYMNIGAQDKALDLYLEGITLLENQTKPIYKKHLCNLYINIGSYYGGMSADLDHEKNLSYQRKALAAAEGINANEKEEYMATIYTRGLLNKSI